MRRRRWPLPPTDWRFAHGFCALSSVLAAGFLEPPRRGPVPLPPLFGFLLLGLLLSDLGLLKGCFFLGFLAGNGRASNARSATGFTGSKLLLQHEE